MTAPASIVTSWATIDDPACERCSAGLSDTAKNALPDMLHFASVILYEFTGHQWPGEHTDKIRPSGCSCRGYEIHPLADGTSWLHHGVTEIVLPGYPVNSIVAVKLNGSVVPAGEYRVDDWRRLVYVPPSSGGVGGWPCSQRLDAPVTEDGTFEVEYKWGAAPPTEGKTCAAVLACQLAIACQPDPAKNGCRLPQRVTSISRQGVSMAILDPLTLFAEGKTGLTEVDMWLDSLRYGQAHRPAQITRPGKSRSRRTT